MAFEKNCFQLLLSIFISDLLEKTALFYGYLLDHRQFLVYRLLYLLIKSRRDRNTVPRAPTKNILYDYKS